MAAIFGFSGTPAKNLLGMMGDVVAHRGQNCETVETPYGSIGIRYHDHQSKKYDTGWMSRQNQHTLVLVGDVYDRAAKRTTAEVLLRKYRAEGIKFTENIKGAYIIAICGPQRFSIFRDGAGHKTAYCANTDGRLHFASEPKSIIFTPSFSRQIRPGAVAQYLSFSFIPGNQTFLEGLFEIPAGHSVSLTQQNDIHFHRFFRFEKLEFQSDSYKQDWLETFKKSFAASVRLRIPEDRKVGVFLSGGIDSSAVVSELAKHYPGTLNTYSIHFGKNYPNELDFARSVAKMYRTEHHEIEVSPRDFIPRLRKMIWHLDDPIGEPITMPNYELASIASRDVNYVFNGEGGDPLFGGPKNLPLLLHHWYGGIERPQKFRETKYLESYRRAFEDISNLITPEFRSHYSQTDELQGVLTPFFKRDEPRFFLNKLMAINIRLKGAHLILPKVEKMTGAWGITPLTPLFDEELIELSFKMPPTWKLRGGIEKFVIKEACRGRLPAAVINRPKSGMRVPVHFWFKDEMRKYCRSLLSKRNIRQAGIFDYNRVRQLLDYNIQEGHGRYGLRLWMLITFEIWRRIVIENEPV